MISFTPGKELSLTASVVSCEKRHVQDYNIVLLLLLLLIAIHISYCNYGRATRCDVQFQKRIFSSPKIQSGSGVPVSHLFDKYLVYSPVVSGQGVNITTHLHLMPRLRSNSTPPIRLRGVNKDNASFFAYWINNSCFTRAWWHHFVICESSLSFKVQVNDEQFKVAFPRLVYLTSM